jgi:hypothetical protein
VAPYRGRSSLVVRGADIVSLSEKIHTYVAFAVDGQMAASFPDVAGQAWGIVIDLQVSPPPDAARRDLERIAVSVKRYGGELRLRYPDEAGSVFETLA